MGLEHGFHERRTGCSELINCPKMISKIEAVRLVWEEAP